MSTEPKEIFIDRLIADLERARGKEVADLLPEEYFAVAYFSGAETEWKYNGIGYEISLRNPVALQKIDGFFRLIERRC